MAPDTKPIRRVTRSKAVAKTSYDRLSRWYDLLAGSSEWRYVVAGLELLAAREGETVLEIGHGTGRALVKLARAVGQAGRVHAIDLSEGMHRMARRRLERAGLLGRVELRCGDAADLPYADAIFDAIFMSFTLELFDTPEIPLVLGGCHRVLRSGGRMAVVAMSRAHGADLPLRLYEFAHKQLPNFIDCRPIYPVQALRRAGFQLQELRERRMWGLPIEILLCVKA